ncbi:MAG: hypothetical protein CL583_18020 [Alteromonadaceae bacterium]|nr:hypothetical protein [Alteromonadaceae bacterium]|tara:strand:+ start:4445 stop:5572 length:1128 start_codon:yes stop_codon:yes gene_type:complete
MREGGGKNEYGQSIMKFNFAGFLLCAVLAGCSGTAPFGEDATDTEEEAEGGTDEGTPIAREGVPPGTASPSPETRIFRKEPTSAQGGQAGDGLATNISYDGTSDTFTVEGLAFDGGNTYQRGNAVSSLNNGAFAVYEAETQFPDSVNAQPINQFKHRAIYGISKNTDQEGNPQTQFAIVRTGAYVGYGFGGFVYQRDNSVDLPSSGQAVFNGSAAGLRDFDGQGDLEYSTANVQIAIDFEDFNSTTGARGDGVRGVFSNRRVYNIDGDDITAQVVKRINDNNSAGLQSIPDARFVVGPGVLDENGDLVGEIDSRYVDNNDVVQEYETGKYYALMSGDDPDEIVGVVVLENSAEFENVTVRDTSGFIVYRDPAPSP